MTCSIEYYVMWYRMLCKVIFYFWRVAINARLNRRKMLDGLNAVKWNLFEFERVLLRANSTKFLNCLNYSINLVKMDYVKSFCDGIVKTFVKRFIKGLKKNLGAASSSNKIFDNLKKLHIFCIVNLFKIFSINCLIFQTITMCSLLHFTPWKSRLKVRKIYYYRVTKNIHRKHAKIVHFGKLSLLVGGWVLSYTSMH